MPPSRAWWGLGLMLECRPTGHKETVVNQDWPAQQYDACMASMCSQLEHRKINICNICIAAARHPCIVPIQMQDSCNPLNILAATLIATWILDDIGIKHDFLCINICWALRVVLKPRAWKSRVLTTPRDQQMFIYQLKHVWSLLLHSHFVGWEIQKTVRNVQILCFL